MLKITEQVYAQAVQKIFYNVILYFSNLRLIDELVRTGLFDPAHLFFYVFLEEDLLGVILFHFAFKAGQKLFTGPNVSFVVKPSRREIKRGVAQSSGSL